MGGKGNQPPPIDPGKSMGEYLFGTGFYNYQGVTDPRLQERIIAAEEQFRPRYAALELKDIQTFAQGIEGGKDSAAYQSKLAEINALKQARQEGASVDVAGTISGILGERPKKGDPKYTKKLSKGASRTDEVALANAQAEWDAKKASLETSLSGELGTGLLDAEIAKAEVELQSLETGGTPGLFDLLEESQLRAGEIQRSSLAAQRAADVAALQEYSPRVVEAYRKADPFSTELADLASQRAQEDLGLAERGERLLDTATEAEKKLLETGATLADLSPTEQEALLQKRGTEFLESTGQLSPLEQRRVEQQARAGSLARGRELDESSLYGEMQARMAEELGKREREIALGSQLLGQDFGMRMQRAGQGGQFLQAGQGIGFQRQGLGAGLIGQEAGIMDRRLGQAYSMQRGIAGDLGAAILGRPSQSIALGSNVLGQAQGQAAGPMGPQLFDPNVGVNLALQQRGQDIQFQGMQAQAQGAMIGGGAQGLGAYAGYAATCWVAREVYGIQNPRWLAFREWMLNDSPSWFRNLYIKYGERFAKFISNKPFIKNIIRKWMDTKIK